MTLATQVDERDAPKDERSVIPEAAEQFYLCVQVREASQGSRFRAIWYEGTDIIGQSEKVVLEDISEPSWLALSYRPIAQLNPAREHAVELTLDDRVIERLIFRVGIGDADDAIAEAAFATGFDESGEPIGTQTRFYIDTPQLTFRVRVSNQVDTSGMIFSTLWYRGETQIAQLAPDPPTPSDQSTPTVDPRRLSFTYVPPSRLTPGSYRVVLLLNGTEVRSMPFVITDVPVPTPTPQPTATPMPEATSTPAPPPIPPATTTAQTSGAQIVDIVVATNVEPGSQRPVDGPLFAWEGEPGSVVVLWVAVAVRDLSSSDTIAIVISRDDTYYGRVVMDAASLDSGWRAHEIALDVPDSGDGPAVYAISAIVNDQRALDTSLQVSADE